MAYSYLSNMDRRRIKKIIKYFFRNPKRIKYVFLNSYTVHIQLIIRGLDIVDRYNFEYLYSKYINIRKRS